MTHVVLVCTEGKIDAYLKPSYQRALAFLRQHVSQYLRLLSESDKQVEQMSVAELSRLITELTNTPSNWLAIASLVAPSPCEVVERKRNGNQEQH